MKTDRHISITIMGAGESGIGAALLAKKQGLRVFVSDRNTITPRHQKTLMEASIPFEMEGHNPEKFLEADLIVKSPGIPGHVPILQDAKAQGVEIISEIEFASRYTKANIIAVTGSNGKTTTTSLIYHLITSLGMDVAVAGNIGNSFAGELVKGNHDWFVLEVSSFQLEDCPTFAPNIAVLLNITEDHLDRYEGQLGLYALAKFKITSNQSPEDTFIYYADDPVIQQLLETQNVQAKQITFSQQNKEHEPHAWLEGDILKLTSGESLDFNSMQLKGVHNKLNTLASLLAVKALKNEVNSLQPALNSFSPVKHRLQTVGQYCGIEFINDSKATNVDATYYALEGMEKPVIWIVGGIDKGNDYSTLRKCVLQKVKTMIVLGQGYEKLTQAFPQIPAVQAYTMKEAIELSIHKGQTGDCVLLSPACASFDLFNNYEDRGNQFIEYVQAYMANDQRITKN